MGQHFYRFNGELLAMSNDIALQNLFAAERKIRTGSCKYSLPPDEKYLKDTVSALKEICPAEILAQIKDKQRVKNDLSALFDVVLHANLRMIEEAHGNKEDSSVIVEKKNKASELALAFALGRCFTEVFSPVQIKTSLRFSKLVVDEEQVDSFKVFVMATHNKFIGRSWLVGWATSEDLKNAPKGNRNTDSENCPWARIAHYITPQSLRPMVKLPSLRNSLPEGILFERVPDEKELPVYCKSPYEDFMPTKGTDKTVDVLGIEPDKPESNSYTV